MRSKKLRDSARGQDCTFQISGVCNGNPETTVLCHLSSETGGMGLKSTDECSAFGCYACHQAVDGHVQSKEYQEHQYFYNFRALVRTLGEWQRLKLLEFKGAK